MRFGSLVTAEPLNCPYKTVVSVMQHGLSPQAWRYGIVTAVASAAVVTAVVHPTVLSFAVSAAVAAGGVGWLMVRGRAHRRQAERALRDEQRRFRDFAESVSDWFWEMDADLRFSWLSERYCEMTGLSPAQTIGRTRIEVARADTADPKWAAHLDDLVNCRPFRDFEYSTPLDDGGTFHCRISGAPVFDASGTFVGYRGAGRNIGYEIETRRRLGEAQSRLFDAVESITEMVALFDANDRLVLCNQRYREDLSVIADILTPGVTFSEIVTALADQDFYRDVAPSRESWVAERLRRHETLDGPAEYHVADGRWLLVNEYRTGDGGTLLVGADVTDRRRGEAELRKMSLAVEHSPVAVLITDADGRLEYVNPKFVAISGYASGEVIGKNPSFLKSGYTTPEQYRAFWETITGGHDWRGEFLNRAKNGDVFWVHATVTPIKEPEGRIRHFLAVQEDITVRRDYERRLIYRANYDELTGLPNRALALDRLQQAIAAARREGRAVIVMAINLDRFKAVNDTLGHTAGDQWLRVVSRRLSAMVGEGETVARIGGDEFLVICRGDSASWAEGFATRILDSLAKPVVLGDHRHFGTVSVGITVYPDDGADSFELLRNAGNAQARATAAGGSTARFFTLKSRQEAVSRLRLESRLGMAIERGELSLRYQPIIDIHTNNTVAAEALLRWDSPEEGEIPAERFNALAEETGMIVDIGAFVLNCACREAASWDGAGVGPISIAVNVSSRQVLSGDIVGVVGDALAASGLPPERLELEITEHLLMDDLAETRLLLQRLSGMGVRLVIDDFGMGYSSLSYLKRFPFDTLKIDRSFVRDVTSDPEDEALVKAILALGHSLGLMVIGEGVETADQLAFLRDHRCDRVQGYYFTEPLPPDRFIAHVGNGGY